MRATDVEMIFEIKISRPNVKRIRYSQISTAVFTRPTATKMTNLMVAIFFTNNERVIITNH